MESEPYKIAAVQAAPVFLDADASVDKACTLVGEAAERGAKLVVFPEAFIPGYPLWVWYIPPGRTHPLRALYSELHRHSVEIPGPHVERLAEAAGDHRVTVAIGVNERNSEASNSTLFNTLLYLGADGQILGKHRKLIPTAGERLVWGQAAGNDLQVFNLPIGRLGGLLCWENYMPLARYFLANEGEQIHLAPTWDRGEPWTSSMRHIAKEGRTFVLSACQVLRMEDIPDHLEFKGEYLAGGQELLNPGLSMIVDPDGRIVAGPLEGEAGILYATVDPNQLIGPRWQLDVAGHYSRPDVFQLHVRREPRPGLVEIEGEEPVGEGTGGRSFP